MNAKDVFPVPWSMKCCEEHYKSRANLLKKAVLVDVVRATNMATIQIVRIFKVLYVRTAMKYGENNESYTA